MNTYKISVGKIGNVEVHAYYDIRDRVEPHGSYDIKYGRPTVTYFDNVLQYQLDLMDKHLSGGLTSASHVAKLVRRKSNPRGKCFKRMSLLY